MSRATTFRVTVRGRFHELSERAGAHLRGARSEHDIFVSAYTPEGTLTYDDRIDFFNLRYECRAVDGDAAAAECREEAERFLDTMMFGYRDLRVSVVDLAAMWDDVGRQNPSDDPPDHPSDDPPDHPSDDPPDHPSDDPADHPPDDPPDHPSDDPADHPTEHG